MKPTHRLFDSAPTILVSLLIAATAFGALATAQAGFGI